MAITATTTKTGTYTPSTSAVATPGTSSAANKALQTSLIAKGATIAADGKYGPQTAAAVAKYGGSGGTTTATNSGPITNPVISADSTRNENYSINRDISGLKAAYAADAAQIQAQQAALAERRKTEVGNIKSEFDVAKAAQEAGQKFDYAGRATGLITSGGGFLGATQSQEGVLQNLKATFEAEKTALMAKRESAIIAANNAYEDKDFALARELSKNAKDLQNEIYGRQKDYADQELAIARETRSKTEFDLGLVDKRIESFSKMTDEQWKNVTPEVLAQTDKYYFPGFTANKREVDKKALEVKTQKEAIGLDADILDMRLKMPQGQKFTLGGVAYTGLKKPETGGSLSDAAQFKSTMDYMRQSIFVPGTTIMGSDGVPFLLKSEADKGNYVATKEGWKEALRVSGMKRADFLNEFKGYLDPTLYKEYGLTPDEIAKVTGQKASVTVSGSDVVLTD